MNKIETSFIGIVQSRKYNHDIGTFGIYVMPIYIWNITNNEWNKIINYKNPYTKYFLYPHFLVLPNIYYHSYPLYFLHTCENHQPFDKRLIQNEFRLFNLSTF